MRDSITRLDDVSQEPLAAELSETRTPHLVFTATLPARTAREHSVPDATAPDAVRASEGYLRFLWLTAILLVMVGLRYLVPWFAEEIQYSITRGRERAQFEQASEYLGKMPLADLSMACQLVSKRIGPSVVHINVANVRNVSDDSGAQFPFSPRDPGPAAGQGSGVIVDGQGYILTNYHVVKGATEIDVGLSDGRRLKARTVGLDMPTDLALLKIDAPDLIAADWGDSEALEVGALVWAAGSPFGLQRTVTFGILSAKHRAGIAGTPYQDFLQTDAAVNPGNSGGPLVDELGRLIGINTAIVGDVYQGVSFAVPSHVAREVYERLRFDGRVARGWLGVQMDEVPAVLAEEVGLAKPSGALVVEVVDIDGRSPARAAGIQPGDIILRWNGDDVSDPPTLSRLVAKTKVGTRATVQILRAGESLDLNVAVGERPVIE